MNRTIVGAIVVLLVAVTACGGDDGGALPRLTAPEADSTPVDVSLPNDISIPAGVSIPPSLSTDAIIDALVTSMEQSGAKVDRDCVADAIKSVDLTELSTDASSMDPAFIQRFISCITPP